MIYAPPPLSFRLSQISIDSIIDSILVWRSVPARRQMSSYSYATSFRNALRKAGPSFRFYDARHTFVTRLAENPGISEETIRQLAGHVSPRMLAQYAHIGAQARRDAIVTLEQVVDGAHRALSGNESTQIPPQSQIDDEPLLN